MRIWEKDGCWIEESYVLAMHTPEGTNYPIGMLRKFLSTVKDKQEATVIIPRDDIYNLFSKHYDLECLDKELGLYKARHKDR